MVRVDLTIDGGIEDLDLQRVQGSQSLRQHRVLRLTEEAYSQGGLLTQEDIGRLLQVSSRTIRSDIHDLMLDGNTVHTRGFDHDIGRGTSHKTRIVDLYLQGLTYDEIMRKSRHSAHAVKRYVCTFGRMLLLRSRDVSAIGELSRLLQLSERVTQEYIELYDRYLDNGHWPKVYKDLVNQLTALYPSKKNGDHYGEAVMKTEARSRYESLPKRSFRNAIIRLLEDHYKILGSHKVLSLVADDIVELHKKFYPEKDHIGNGCIVWHTTGAQTKKPSYGTRVEDYAVKTVILPLITDEDVEQRIRGHYGIRNNNCDKQIDRDITVMARLVKSAYEQGGLLSGAELSVLLNRSLTAIGRYLRLYHERNTDILPTKGLVLDQGSKPSHKGSIINLYEQGYPEVDIARITTHTIEAVGRDLRRYKNVKLLLEKGFTLMEMVRTTGMGRSTLIQYRDLVLLYHGELSKEDGFSEALGYLSSDEGGKEIEAQG